MSRVQLGSVLGLSVLLGVCGASQGMIFVGPGGGIRDGGSTGFDIVISGTGATVGSVNSVTVNNMYHSDTERTSIALYRSLTPETGVVVFLTAETFGLPGSKDAEYNGTYTFLADPSLSTFSDVALATVGPVPSGTYAMQRFVDFARTDFSEFAGLPLDGTWTLIVNGLQSANPASLGSWSMNVTVVPEPVSGAWLLAGLPLLARRRSR